MSTFPPFAKSCAIVFIMLCIVLSGCTQTVPSESSETEQTSTDVSDVSASAPIVYTYTDAQIYDKLLGGWVGQMAGVVYGAKAEFGYCGTIMPETDVVDFSALNINDAFWQDDLYVEMTFLEVMAEHGLYCDLDLLGQAFADSEYTLDHANKQARLNLQNGIAANMSGHYTNNLHCDDIDWQIESDFIGLICGGDAQTAAERAFEIGHMICYGDGVYGGVFVATMTAAAFVSEDIDSAIATAFDALPDGTEFKTVLEQVRAGHQNGLTWEENWAAIETAWGKDDRCVSYYPYASNIDAKLNSAYVLMGLLYGQGDFETSLTIALRCGQDNDCNASTVGGILGVLLGYDGIPTKYKTNIDANNTKFSYTNYTLQEAVDTTMDLFCSRMSQNEDSTWSITASEVTSVAFEQWAEAPTVTFSASSSKDKATVNVSAYSVPGIKEITIDFGDGYVSHESVAGYRYQTAGTYEIVCTVTDVLDNAVVGKQKVQITDVTPTEPAHGTYRNIAPEMAIICTDSTPTGSGSKDIFVISDDTVGKTNLLQYDTYVGYLGAHDEYIGYLFDTAYEIDRVVFTEGMHFDNGGWFAGGTLHVQVLIDGVWTDVDASVSPAYPNGNAMSAFGAMYEEYTFAFDSIRCDGVRLIGTAGGVAGFVSVSELAVMGIEAQ